MFSLVKDIILFFDMGMFDLFTTPMQYFLQSDMNYQQQMQQQSNNIELWRMDNQYNSPSNQIARMRAAGINPDLQSGSVTSGNSSGAPSAAERPYLDVPNIGAAVDGAIQDAFQLASTVQSIKGQSLDNDMKALDSFFQSGGTINSLFSGDATDVGSLLDPTNVFLQQVTSDAIPGLSRTGRKRLSSAITKYINSSAGRASMIGDTNTFRSAVQSYREQEANPFFELSTNVGDDMIEYYRAIVNASYTGNRRQMDENNYVRERISGMDADADARSFNSRNSFQASENVLLKTASDMFYKKVKQSDFFGATLWFRTYMRLKAGQSSGIGSGVGSAIGAAFGGPAGAGIGSAIGSIF